MNDLKSIGRHVFDARWIHAAPNKLLLHHQQLQNVRKVVVQIVLLYIVSHYEFEKILHYHLRKLLAAHIAVVALWHVRALLRGRDFLEMAKT